MSQIILDISGGNTHKNNIEYAKQMIDEVVKIDTKKHEVIFKAQLSLPDGINLPLEHDVFDYIYNYCASLGYKVTSSVADLESLKVLLQYDVPFVKLPNDRKLDYLIDYIPRGMKIYISVAVGSGEMVERSGYYLTERYLHDELADKNMVFLDCVSKYPASKEDYFLKYTNGGTYIGTEGVSGISDHTTDWELYKLVDIYDYAKSIWEVHFKLLESTGLDAGEFARTPESLVGIL
jgi:sialic acid synthase SpsE